MPAEAVPAEAVAPSSAVANSAADDGAPSVEAVDDDPVAVEAVDDATVVDTVRTAIELSVLGIGWALGGNVGFGTVLFACTIGPIIHFVLHRVNRGPYTRAVLTDPEIASAP